jgi:hypothetical protein
MMSVSTGYRVYACTRLLQVLSQTGSESICFFEGGFAWKCDLRWKEGVALEAWRSRVVHWPGIREVWTQHVR